LRLLILDRDRNVCQMRGPKCRRYATDVDHIVAVSEGGAFYDPANLRAACRACNGRGGAMITNARAATAATYVGRF